jgi:hypothetical protein
MNVSRILRCSLALSGLATLANAQTISITINLGSSWVLNTSSSPGPVSVQSCNFPGSPCQVTDGQCATVSSNINLTVGASCPDTITASYGGSNLSCALTPVSASSSSSGFADFVFSTGTGGFDFDLISNAGTSTPNPHSTGQASADFTISLYSPFVAPPPLVKPPFNLVLSNSASVTGTGTPVTSNFTRATGSKSSRDYFSVTVDVSGASSVSLPASFVAGAFASVSATTNPSSFVLLRN